MFRKKRWTYIYRKIVGILIVLFLTLGFLQLPVLAAELFESEGVLQEGWYQEEGKTYYYVAGEMQTGWQEIEGKKYYFSPTSGEMQTGWQEIEGKKYYFSPTSGEMQAGWQEIEGKKYYFLQTSGELQTGKQKIGKGTYYFKKSGQQQTGWVKLKGKKYYFSPKNGKMLTGKQKIGKGTYYFKKNGQRKTGWVKLKGKKYYFSHKSGKMLTGRRKIKKNAYYFNRKGVLQTSRWLYIGSKTYYCKSNGVLQSGWMNQNGKTYYFSPGNNVMQTDWQKIEGYNYYFMPSGSEKGVLQKNHIVDTSTGSFFVDAQGVQVTSAEIVNAVGFVKNNTDSSWSDDVKLQRCYEVLWRNYSYQRFMEQPTAQVMSDYANYMFVNGRGNCYRYAACFACIAKVLGYESRVAVGQISSPRHGMSPHGWTEVNVGGIWYICDANMQKNFSTINSYMCTEGTYVFRHSCSVRYTLIIENGGVSWV